MRHSIKLRPFWRRTLIERYTPNTSGVGMTPVGVISDFVETAGRRKRSLFDLVLVVGVRRQDSWIWTLRNAWFPFGVPSKQAKQGALKRTHMMIFALFRVQGGKLHNLRLNMCCSDVK